MEIILIMKTIKHTFLMFLFIPGIKCVIYRRRETGNTGDVQKLIAHLQNVLRNVDHMWCISTIPKKKQRKIEQPPPPPRKKSGQIPRHHLPVDSAWRYTEVDCAPTKCIEECGSHVVYLNDSKEKAKKN